MNRFPMVFDSKNSLLASIALFEEKSLTAVFKLVRASAMEVEMLPRALDAVSAIPDATFLMSVGGEFWAG